MIKAAIYGRVSTDRQSELSIEAQVDACKAFVDRQGWVVHDIYTDFGISGTGADNRPALQRLIQDVKDGNVNVFVAHKVDRAFRNTRDYENCKYLLQEQGVFMAFAETGGSNEDHNTELMNGILACLAQYYSANLARETRKSAAIRAKAGQFMGGVPPFGYRVSQDKRFEIVPEQEEIVQAIFRKYAKGETMQSICDWLNESGCRTTRGDVFRVCTLHGILKNEKYIGVYTYNRNQYGRNGKRHGKKARIDAMRVEGVMPAIIEPGLWKAVQTRMENNRQESAETRAKRVYLLSGLLKCGECGSPMISQPKKSQKGYETYYYMCNGRKRKTGCVMPLVRKEWIESHVIDSIERCCDSMNVEEIIGNLNETKLKEQTEAGSRLASLSAKLRETRRRIEVVTTAISDMGLNPDLRQKLEALTQERITLEKEIQNLEEQRDHFRIIDPVQIAKGIQLIAADLRSEDDETRRTAIRLVTKEIKIDRQKLTVYLLPHWEDELVAEGGLEPPTFGL